MHTLLDLRGIVPTYAAVTAGKVHDVRMLDGLPVTEDAIFTMDKAYTDFSRLYALQRQGAFFVIRAKDNLRFKRLYSAPKDKAAGIKADQTITLVTYKSKKDYPEKLRRVICVDKEPNKHLVFWTNSFTIPATTVAKIFKQRWQVELFFKSKKKLDIPCPLYTFLQILEVNLFEKKPIFPLVADSLKQIQGLPVDNQLKL